jgi:hypothetical protein
LCLSVSTMLSLRECVYECVFLFIGAQRECLPRENWVITEPSFRFMVILTQLSRWAKVKIWEIMREAWEGGGRSK